MEASVPFGAELLTALAALPDDTPAALFMRHAERYAIEDSASPEDVPLTPAGERAARVFGSRLPRTRFLRLFHSPIPRCRVTAERIAEGFAAAGGRVAFTGMLDGLCRSFILDSDGVYTLMRRYRGGGSNDFIRDWFDGRFDPAVIDPCHVAAEKVRKLAETAIEHAGPDSLTILVTHDWEILTLREAFLGARHEEVGWVDFLDGLAITRNGATMQFRWREFTARQ